MYKYFHMVIQYPCDKGRKIIKEGAGHGKIKKRGFIDV
jgi:hypothetical protein